MEKTERIKELTVCSYCEKLLKKPRLLPCLHAFCVTCLLKMIREQDEVVCPKCSENHGNGLDAETLPKDVLAESLIYMGQTGKESGETFCSSCDTATEEAVDRCLDCGEFLCSECSSIHRRLRQTRDHEIITLEEYDGTNEKEEVVHRSLYCESHPSEELRYFCEKCKEIVCRECTAVKHKSHKYTHMQESSTMKLVVQTIEGLVARTQSKVDKVRKAIEEVNATSDLITGSIVGLKTSVRTTATEMVRRIRIAEEEMITEIDRIQSRKFHGLNQQLKDLERNLEVFEAGKCYTENGLRYLSEAELFLVKDIISNRLKVLNKKKITRDPVDDNNLKHVKESRKGQKMAQNCLGYLEINGNLVINGSVREVGDFNYITAPVAEPSPHLKGIAVDIRGPGGELLSPLRQERENHGDFGVDFQTERTGIHNVLVSVDGVPVQGSPLQVIIDDPPSPHISPSPSISPVSFGNTGRITGRLQDAHGIATDGQGQVIVTDTNCHRVQIFEKSGRFLRMFGRLGIENTEFRSPHDVAVSKEDHLVVADTGNGRIQIFDNNGRYLRSIYCQDSDDETFCPYGVAIDREDNIITIDREKSKLRIYKSMSKGEVLLEFGSVGSGAYQFVNPSYITVNQNGHIIVSDMGNDRIQVFTSAGTLLFMFGKTGVGNGEFRWPTGIAVKMNGDIVVADSCNNRIQTFRADGSFVCCQEPFEREEERLKLPEGLTVDEQDNVIVADWGNNRIQVLR